ncbi:MAG: DUF1553 domain-containing protein [Planctomycetaceae bacterium]|nr:DUF1553 domain-containing protein [Planctomycetaceae bacterium]
MIRVLPALIAMLAGSIQCGPLAAKEPPIQQLEFFEAKIRPVLIEHCYQCHAADAKNVRGGLLLDTRAGIRRGGESGPAVVPNDIEESLLLSALRHDSFEMPPDRKLADSIIADFEKWISMGAPDPRDGEVQVAPTGVDIEAGKQFWCFQPIARAAVPQVEDLDWPATDVDRFILQRLEANGLTPGADADGRTLLRRAYFDLTGLPPTPEQIDEFLQNDSPEAFEQVIDELLRSPHFGERWGRHWLDVVRFAESSGGGRTLLFPEAWRYRDYVIDAFNSDLAYDLFVKQQIAGDLLETSDLQERRRQLTATAFLLLGPTNYELQDKQTLEMDIVDEQLDTLGKAFLGMTLGCARCHDHKFDPIPTHDYYALAGILKSTQSVIHENVSKWNEVTLPMSPQDEAVVEKVEAQVAALDGDLKALKAELSKIGGRPSNGVKSIDPASLPGIVVDDTQAEKRGNWTLSQSVAGYVGDNYLHSTETSASVTFAPKLPQRGKYELRIAYTPGSNRSAKVPVRIYHAAGEATVYIDQTKAGVIAGSMESVGFYGFDPEQNPRVIISPAGAASGVVIADAAIFISEDTAVNEIAREEMFQQKERKAQLTSEIKMLEKKIAELQASSPQRDLVMAVTDLEKVGNIPVSIRGLVRNPGPVVSRGFLQVAVHGEMPHIGDDHSGRRQLAEWITDPQNPLTSRVMVNRVWHWLYGRGLVTTVDNFGATGDTPSHPELLDYLASKFVDEGWSVKKLIRQLMLSRTYRLSSQVSPQAAAVDPDNRLLWRMNRRRLDAESIRDALLMLGGNLDLSIGGPNIAAGTKSEYGYQFASTRRSVYLPVFRNELPQIFATFDFADPNTQIGSRSSSTTAPQALLLMNHPMVMKQSQAAAEKLLSQEELSASQRIHIAYEQVLGRLPNEREAELAARFVGDNLQPDRWGLLYQALFQSLDFRYVQ